MLVILCRKNRASESRRLIAWRNGLASQPCEKRMKIEMLRLINAASGGGKADDEIITITGNSGNLCQPFGEALRVGRQSCHTTFHDFVLNRLRY